MVCKIRNYYYKMVGNKVKGMCCVWQDIYLQIVKFD